MASGPDYATDDLPLRFPTVFKLAVVVHSWSSELPNV